MSRCKVGLRSLFTALTTILGAQTTVACAEIIALDRFTRVDGPGPVTGGAGGDNPGSGGDGGAGGSPPMEGWVRLAHMSPDSMSVDFCVTGSDGFPWPSGYPAYGVSYPGAGTYVTLPADLYQISIIPAGLDCSTPLLTIPDFVLATGSYHTVIMDGQTGNQSLGVSVILDESSPMMGNIYLNACHETSGAPPVQIGVLDTNDMFTSLFNDPSAITFQYQSCYSQEVPAPIAMGTILAVSTDGTTIDGRWTIPVDLYTTGATFWLYGTDATDIGMYACINVGEGTCTPLPVAN